MLFSTEDEKLMIESRNILDKLNSQKNKIKPLHEVMFENQKKFDKGKQFFEQYDNLSNELKMKIDFMYYEQLLQKLEESVVTNVERSLISLYKTINSIYEHINIKPGIYGNIDSNILNESIGSSKNKLAKLIYEYIDRNFYSMTPDQRKNKYYEIIKEDAKYLITEGMSPEDAIVHSIKTSVMEGLLRQIAFPFAEWSRVKYLNEDEDYDAVFDNETLTELIDLYNTKIHNIAKIVATCV